MRKPNNIILLTLLCLCVCKSIIIWADDDVDYLYVLAETVLLNQNEVYNPDRDYYVQSRYYECIIVDSSSIVTDTLCGRALYYLHFDTTNLSSGIELQRTGDTLYFVHSLNRDIEKYNRLEIKNAPLEIIVADSLIRKSLSSKRIIMRQYSPYYLPLHPITVEFTIVPLKINP